MESPYEIPNQTGAPDMKPSGADYHFLHFDLVGFLVGIDNFVCRIHFSVGVKHLCLVGEDVARGDSFRNKIFFHSITHHVFPSDGDSFAVATIYTSLSRLCMSLRKSSTALSSDGLVSSFLVHTHSFIPVLVKLQASTIINIATSNLLSNG